MNAYVHKIPSKGDSKIYYGKIKQHKINKELEGEKKLMLYPNIKLIMTTTLTGIMLIKF